jgi:hypothetical protein
MSADIERIREFKKRFEAIEADIALVDNQAKHDELSQLERRKEITIEERRNLSKLRK